MTLCSQPSNSHSLSVTVLRGIEARTSSTATDSHKSLLAFTWPGGFIARLTSHPRLVVDAQRTTFAGCNECSAPVLLVHLTIQPMTRLFHPFLALISSSTDRELARYIESLKAENKILRAPIPRQVHAKLAEQKWLLKSGKVLGKRLKSGSASLHRHIGNTLPVGAR